MISTRELSSIPDIPNLRKLTQSLALLDAIICPDWGYRYYSFDIRWTKNVSTFFMRNGSGDEFIILFAKEGAVIKGFAHESIMSPFRNDPPKMWKGVIDKLPKFLRTYLSDPALELIATTFCIWRTVSDTKWKCGKIAFPDDDLADGSGILLSILDGKPETYQQYAQEYFGKAIDLSVVQHIYQHMPLTDELVKKLNDSLQITDIDLELRAIGYGD